MASERDYTQQEREKAERQSAQMFRDLSPTEGDALYRAGRVAIELALQRNRLAAALEEMLDGVEPDCGAEDCEECKPYRNARAALTSTAKE